LTSSGIRITGATKRRLHAFAVIQIAASFVLLAGAGMLLKTLIALQMAQPGFETRSVLAVNVPVSSFGKTQEQVRAFYRTLQEQLSTVSGVERVAIGSVVPWRDTGNGNPGLAFAIEGRKSENPQDDPHGQLRSITPGFFGALGIRLIAGRDFNEADRDGAERVVIINQRIANELFAGQDPINRHLQWTDGLTKFIGLNTEPRRIIGVAADVDDERVDPAPKMTVYHPFEQELGGGRLFIHVKNDPYALVPAVTRIVHDLSAEQVVERAATLEDIRAEVLAPERLNTIVFGGFATVALAISIVGVAGVLAFSVSARTREFGVRLAIGSQPGRLLRGVLVEGVVMAAVGIAAGVVGGWVLARVIGSYLFNVQMPGVVPILGAALLLLLAAGIASLLPAARAARIDVMQALRSE
jgi:predicted permease